MAVSLFRVCLPVDDLEQAVRFYSDLFHTDGERITPNLHHFRLGETLLACHNVRADGLPAAPPHNAPLYIAVDDRLETLHQRVGTLGARHVDPEIRSLPSGETGFLLRDPAGNRIALVDARTRQWHAPDRRPAPPVVQPGDATLALQRDFLNRVKSGSLQHVKDMLILDPELAGARDGAGISAILHAAHKQHLHIATHLADCAGTVDLWEGCVLGRARDVATALDARPEQVNQPSADGFRPLGLAASFGRVDCVELLLARGADVNAPSTNGRELRPLHSAVSHADAGVALKIARRLLVAGADVNAVQEAGYTALHQAADRGETILVGLLLQAGARSDLAAATGRTPLALALARNHTAVAGMLRAHERAKAAESPAL